MRLTRRYVSALAKLAKDVHDFAVRTGSSDVYRAWLRLESEDLRGADDFLDQAESDGYRVGGLRDRLMRIRSRGSRI